MLEGLRIDHIDGLLDPKGYLLRLREQAPARFYLVVEKILARHEALREDWPVEGTTGYEFANLVLGLLVDPAGEEGFTQTYAAFTGEHRAFDEIVRDCKIRIMLNEMASELNVLARDAGRVARQNPRTADFTRNILQRGTERNCRLLSGIPHLRRWRCRAGGSGPARHRLGSGARAAERDGSGSQRLRFSAPAADDRPGRPAAQRLQPAVGRPLCNARAAIQRPSDGEGARGHRLLSLQPLCRIERGRRPSRSFRRAIAAFHRANAQRAERWPHAMLGTSTHDTKRGEDTRARLAVLSEMPEEWARQVQAWSRILRARRGDVEGTAPPDRNDEYLFYQLLLGAWPAELTGIEELEPERVRSFAERIEGAMVKSLREAKLRSTWASPNTPYEEAMLGFVRDALDISRPNAFLTAFLPFQDRVARLGVRNSIVQTALKLTLPGMPDIYQGTELWDLSLVDPDNRRPVDYEARQELFEQALAALQRNRATIHEMLENWRDGRIKLAVTALLLAYRRDHPKLFANGGYDPLIAAGSRADQICAFARSFEEDAVLVAAARFPVRWEGDRDWAGMEIPWPQSASGRSHWIDLLSGRVIERRSECFEVQAVLADMPAAILVPHDAEREL